MRSELDEGTTVLRRRRVTPGRGVALVLAALTVAWLAWLGGTERHATYRSADGLWASEVRRATAVRDLVWFVSGEATELPDVRAVLVDRQAGREWCLCRVAQSEAEDSVGVAAGWDPGSDAFRLDVDYCFPGRSWQSGRESYRATEVAANADLAAGPHGPL
jgi:hypothetical protein